MSVKVWILLLANFFIFYLFVIWFIVFWTQFFGQDKLLLELTFIKFYVDVDLINEMIKVISYTL